MRAIGPILLLLSLLLAVAPAPAATLHSTTLANGLGLTVVHDSSSALVAVHLAIKVSYSQESYGMRGARTLVQQEIMALLAKRIATDARLSVIQLGLTRADAIAPVGVEWDFVEMSLLAPADELRTCLELLAEVAFTAPLPAEALEAARSQALQQRAALSAGGIEAAYYLFQAALLDAPYDLDAVHGDPRALAGISYDDLVAFRAKHYVPANAVLAICGGAPLTEAIADAERVLGAIPRGEVNDWQPSRPAQRRSRARVSEGSQLRQAVLTVGVAAPAPADPDFAVGSVIGRLLGGPEGRLRRDADLANALGLTLPGRGPASLPFDMMPFALEAQPHLAAWCVCAPDRIEPARRKLRSHFQALMDSDVGAEELARARALAATELAAQMHAPQACAPLMNRAVLFGADPKAFLTLPDRAWAVTAAQVRALAERWFDQEYVGVQMPHSLRR